MRKKSFHHGRTIFSTRWNNNSKIMERFRLLKIWVYYGLMICLVRWINIFVMMERFFFNIFLV